MQIRSAPGHTEMSPVVPTRILLAGLDGPAPYEGTRPEVTFDEVYDAHVDFVWRSVRRLGVGESACDDGAPPLSNTL